MLSKVQPLPRGCPPPKAGPLTPHTPGTFAPWGGPSPVAPFALPFAPPAVPPSPCRRHWCCSGHRARRLQRPRGQSCFVRGWLGISKPHAHTTYPDSPPTPRGAGTPCFCSQGAGRKAGAGQPTQSPARLGPTIPPPPPRSHGSPADLPGTLFTQQPSRKKKKKHNGQGS